MDAHIGPQRGACMSIIRPGPRNSCGIGRGRRLAAASHRGRSGGGPCGRWQAISASAAGDPDMKSDDPSRKSVKVLILLASDKPGKVVAAAAATCRKGQGNLLFWERGITADLPRFRGLSTKKRYVLEEIEDRVLGPDEA